MNRVGYSRLFISFSIVVLTAVISALIKYDIGKEFPMQNYAFRFSVALNSANAILTFLSIICFYFIVPALSHLMAILFDGNLGIKNLLLHTGFGFLPLLISTTFLYLFLDAIFLDYIVLYENNTDIIKISALLANDPYILMFKYLNIAAQIFILVWIVYGLKKYYYLSYVKSLLSVLVPIVMIYCFCYLF